MYHFLYSNILEDQIKDLTKDHRDERSRLERRNQQLKLQLQEVEEAYKSSNQQLIRAREYTPMKAQGNIKVEIFH